jgi:hypothetical protein
MANKNSYRRRKTTTHIIAFLVAFLMPCLETQSASGATQNPALQVPPPQTSTAHPKPANPQGSHPQCPPLDRAGLMRLLEASPEKELQLVFFSGWCSDCAAHLKNLNNPNTILIGTFDKQPRIEKVVGKLKLSNPCFTDAGIGKILDVKTVPTERRLTLESLQKPK